MAVSGNVPAVGQGVVVEAARLLVDVDPGVVDEAVRRTAGVGVPAGGDRHRAAAAAPDETAQGAEEPLRPTQPPRSCPHCRRLLRSRWRSR